MSAALDDEIAGLQARADALRALLKIQASTLLSSPSTASLLSNASPTPQLTLPRTSSADTRAQLASQAAAQRAHNQQSLYRACASVTTFRVRDPDPCAVDGGAVLGVRFEVARRGRFLRPYYVLLNRPYADKRALRVHRHTVPPGVALAGLAARHLPPPRRATADSGDGGGGETAAERQDLARFVRALRRGLVRYHNRMAAVADLRRATGLRRAGKADGKGVQHEGDARTPGRFGLIDISLADAEAKQIKVEWADGRTGRLVVDEDGEIVKFVVFGEAGRDRAAEKELLGGDTRLEAVAKRLALDLAT